MVGRVGILSTSKRISMNMSCPWGCCSPIDAFILVSPHSKTAKVGDQFSLSATVFEIDCDNAIQAVPAAASWGTWNPSIATVNNGQVTCNSAGVATIYAEAGWTVYGEPPPCEGECNPESWCSNPIFLLPYDEATVFVTPSVTGISPARGLIGATTSVTLQGNGFAAGATVNAGTGISVTINSISATQIQASFNVSTSTQAGDHSVTVTVNGQTSNSVNFFGEGPSGKTATNTAYPGSGWRRLLQRRPRGNRKDGTALTGQFSVSKGRPSPAQRGRRDHSGVPSASRSFTSFPSFFTSRARRKVFSPCVTSEPVTSTGSPLVKARPAVCANHAGPM